jgi:formylmethanofuran dehydrogenase subunit E
LKINTYSREEYLRQLQSFHGSLAPNLIIGGGMVNLALRSLPKDKLFDAICETPLCLPDAIQLLTPCTISNGWLRVLNFGRFVITLYEKYGSVGVRDGLSCRACQGESLYVEVETPELIGPSFNFASNKAA